VLKAAIWFVFYEDRSSCFSIDQQFNIRNIWNVRDPQCTTDLYLLAAKRRISMNGNPARFANDIGRTNRSLMSGPHLNRISIPPRSNGQCRAWERSGRSRRGASNKAFAVHFWPADEEQWTRLSKDLYPFICPSLLVSFNGRISYSLYGMHARTFLRVLYMGIVIAFLFLFIHSELCLFLRLYRSGLSQMATNTSSFSSCEVAVQTDPVQCFATISETQTWIQQQSNGGSMATTSFNELLKSLMDIPECKFLRCTVEWCDIFLSR
jgi:hypothetical protein